MLSWASEFRNVARAFVLLAVQGGRSTLLGVTLGVSAVSALAAVALAATATAAAPRPITAAQVQHALTRDGYPARIRCGMGLETAPIPPRRSRLIKGKLVRRCWVLVERDGYHVSVSLFKDAAAAQVSHEHIRNRWATKNWRRATGNALISSYRLPSHDRLRILQAIAALT